MSSKQRIGLIGVGAWGKNYVQTLKSFSNAELAVVCSGNPNTKNLVSSTTAIVKSWREAIDSFDLDGVIIATPPETHTEILTHAIESGLPAMVEKPLALSVDEVSRLQQLLVKRPLPVLVDYVHLFNSGFIAFQKECRKLGPLRGIRSQGGNQGPFRSSYSALWDYGSHDVSMILSLMQQAPLHVKTKVFEEKKTELGFSGHYQFTMIFENGVQAEVSVGNDFIEKSRWIEAQFDGERKQIFDDLIPVQKKPPLQNAVEAFLNALSGHPSEYLGLGLALEVTKVLSAVTRN